VAMQIEYNLVDRTAERELLPMARSLDIGVTAWTPLGGGWLTGKYLNTMEQDSAAASPSGPNRLDDPVMGRFIQRRERNGAIAEEVARIAGEIGCAPAHVALNWLRRRGTIPIFAARTVTQLRQNLACFDYPLTDEHVDRLDKSGKTALGYPHDFLRSGIVKS